MTDDNLTPEEIETDAASERALDGFYAQRARDQATSSSPPMTDDNLDTLIAEAKSRALARYGEAADEDQGHPQDTDAWEDAERLDRLAAALVSVRAERDAAHANNDALRDRIANAEGLTTQPDVARELRRAYDLIPKSVTAE